MPGDADAAQVKFFVVWLQSLCWGWPMLQPVQGVVAAPLLGAPSRNRSTPAQLLGVTDCKIAAWNSEFAAGSVPRSLGDPAFPFIPIWDLLNCSPSEPLPRALAPPKTCLAITHLGALWPRAVHPWLASLVLAESVHRVEINSSPNCSETWPTDNSCQ